MNIDQFRQRRAAMELEARSQFQHQKRCLRCRQTEVGCFCHVVREFDPKMKFVILIHPIEVRRRIATGRMAHLILKNSELILGEDFTEHARVNEILRDGKFEPVVMYPGRDAIDIGQLSADEQRTRFQPARELVIFVIDGTWATAKKTIRSENLKDLPKICFSPSTPSRFRIRKQPAEGCYSTIEAIHQTIELLAESREFDLETQQHRGLLDAFDWMVERQMTFSPVHNPNHEVGFHTKCRLKKQALNRDSQLGHKP